MQDFKKLRVWEKSHKLTLRVYKVTGSFPYRRNVRTCEPDAKSE